MNASPRPDVDLDIRSLRAFVAAAEELHFTRAAARLFVAQQALSRDIGGLEARLGTPLFVRTTRRVTLTPEGERLLPAARELVRLHDRLVADVREPRRPVIVDLMSEGPLTALTVLEAARELAPQIEFRGRYGGATGISLRRLEAAELDVAFGRVHWRGAPAHRAIEFEPLRYEPLALLLPASHPLAGHEAVPASALAGQELDANPADADALEWSDLVRQVLDRTDAWPTPPHVSATGLDDQAHHLVQQGLPILTLLDHRPVAGGVVRPIVDPVLLYPWSIAWRAGSHPSGLTAIRDAAAATRDAGRWLELPADAWLPEPEASLLAGGSRAGG